MRAFHLEGKPVQYAAPKQERNVWHNAPSPSFDPHSLWRRKPEASTAVLPPGMKWHNPDNLTPEQVGASWRLLVSEEVDGRYAGGRYEAQYWNGQGWYSTGDAKSNTITYRLPASVPVPPLPEPAPLWSCAEDVPNGYIRRKGQPEGWATIVGANSMGVSIVGYRRGFPDTASAHRIPYTRLDKWETSPDRSPGSWRECSKGDGK